MKDEKQFTKKVLELKRKGRWLTEGVYMKNLEKLIIAAIKYEKELLDKTIYFNSITSITDEFDDNSNDGINEMTERYVDKINRYEHYLNKLNNLNQCKCNIYQILKSDKYYTMYLRGVTFKNHKPDVLEIIIYKCKKCGGYHYKCRGLYHE